MKVAVIGATGVAGSVITKVLEERKFPVTGFIPVATPASIGKTVLFNNTPHPVVSLDQCFAQNPAVVFLSAGSAVSMEWAPKFARTGAIVIDTSSAWRKHEKVPLIIPEINAHIIKERDRIVAIPNSAVTTMLMALAPLHQRYKIDRIVVLALQSVASTGRHAIKQLENEQNGVQGDTAYPYPINMNIIPQCGAFLHSGYTTEEMKLLDETHKILNNDDIKISATVVRIPVLTAHCQSLNVEFKESFELEQVKILYADTRGIALQDDILNSVYPMPIYAQGKDDVFIGRLRRDETRPNAVKMWVVSDVLRKGTATNAVQVAEYIINEFRPGNK